MEGKYVALLSIILVSATAGTMYFVLPVINRSPNDEIPVEASIDQLLNEPFFYRGKLVKTRGITGEDYVAVTYTRILGIVGEPEEKIAYFRHNGEWVNPNVTGFILSLCDGEQDRIIMLRFQQQPSWYEPYEEGITLSEMQYADVIGRFEKVEMKLEMIYPTEVHTSTFNEYLVDVTKIEWLENPYKEG